MTSVPKTSDTNDLGRIKHQLLAVGSAKVTGIPLPASLSSTAGPSAGKGGSVFFSDGVSRIRLMLDEKSTVHIENYGDSAVLTFEGPNGPVFVDGFVEKTGCHCPKQAYITINEGCIFSCRYCSVPNQEKHIKTPDEIVSLIKDACSRDTIECISLTSGVVGTVREEDARLFTILEKIRVFDLPIGVSVYPTPGLSKRLFELGVSEVKFNLETATEKLFAEMCPGLDWEEVWAALKEAVGVFGKNCVYTNIILGLGESKDEMKQCIRQCLENGIIPIIRPLTPSPDLSDFTRPSAGTTLEIAEYLREQLPRFGLDPTEAKTMCAKCMGCDLTPMADLPAGVRT
ncbi:radical SAM protein [Methanocorpusculum parvum]|uniref:Radical SAM protein n=1 Tax=Methanocorpusculum parvum TaxID=2193 RepID=A0AAX0QAR6_9EURY|nr:radical SAM protein [Methanocorpusculum parvum]PAV10276.1 radical SAM protein [Methanocorpusculum parvum]